MVSVKVEIESQFLADESEPDAQEFVFAYHVRIVNDGDVGVRVMRRYWFIEDGSGRDTEVEGEGVVGQTPYIAPNDHYRYTSFARLEAPVGRMSGHYWVETDTGETVKIEIPPFTLKADRWVH